MYLFGVMLILVLIFIIIVCSTTICDVEKFHNYNNSSEFKYAKPETVREIYKMLFIADQLFEEYDIIYWISGGTLLGAIRHKGMIPWDDDADVMIFDFDEEKISFFYDYLDVNGYVLMKTWFGYKIFPKNGKEIKGFKWKFPALDIFVMRTNGNTIYFKYKRAQNKFGKCIFYESEFFPLKRYEFGSLNLYGPKDPISYLSRCYGDDWDTHAYLIYDHEHEKKLENIKKKLTNFEKQPAVPFYP